MANAGVFTAARMFLVLLWLRFCAMLVHFLRVRGLKPTSQFFHKVVIIGDDFAAGLGDYVTMGSDAGLAAHLKQIVVRSDKVRHNWEIINAGVPGSLSGDWLLNAPKQYFDRVFKNRSMGDAEIVIIVLGSNELRLKSSTTSGKIFKNIASLCDTLRKKGKQVCVSTVASPSPLQQEADLLPLNSMLEEFCKCTKTDDSTVTLGPRLDSFSYRRESALSFDQYHFNSSSYKLLARNCADFLIPMMTAIEWKTWKNEIHKVTYDKALYD